MSMLLILIFKLFEFNIVSDIIKVLLLELLFIIILFDKSFLFKPFSFFFLLIYYLSFILTIRFPS